MGSNTARDFSDSVKMGTLRLDTALMYHLQSNHYSPLPTSLIPACKRAIEYANQGDYNHKVRLPKDVTYKGLTLAPVYAMIENFHLDFFLAQEESEEY